MFVKEATCLSVMDGQDITARILSVVFRKNLKWGKRSSCLVLGYYLNKVLNLLSPGLMNHCAIYYSEFWANTIQYSLWFQRDTALKQGLMLRFAGKTNLFLGHILKQKEKLLMVLSVGDSKNENWNATDTLSLVACIALHLPLFFLLVCSPI